MNYRNNRFLVFKGEIGVYPTMDIALVKSRGNINDILELPNRNIKYFIKNELIKLAHLRPDLDFLQYDIFIGRDDSIYLDKLNKDSFYVTIYYNRLIKDDIYRYGLALSHNFKGLHIYINPTDKIRRGDQSDIYAIIKIKEWQDKYGIKGKIITPVPIKQTDMNILTDWEIEEVHPLKHDLVLDNLNRMLKGENALIGHSIIL